MYLKSRIFKRRQIITIIMIGWIEKATNYVHLDACRHVFKNLKLMTVINICIIELCLFISRQVPAKNSTQQHIKNSTYG